MGIPHFYGEWLKNEHPNSIVKFSGNNIEGISFDLNGLLHSTAEETYAYGKFQTKENLSKISYLTESDLEAEYFTNLTRNIKQILEATRPKQYVIICIDGVAPLAKINQQRSRRFMSNRNEINIGIQLKFKFNSNCITPGTEFMEKLNVKLHNWLYINRETFPAYMVYSSHLSPGEGEHKMMKHLKNLFNENKITQGDGYHIIYGKDADLVMLAALSPVKNILISREQLYNNISVDKLMDEVCNELGMENNREICIRDFVLMDFLIGNDFLPHIPSLDGINTITKTLFDIYKELKTPLTYEKYDIYKINWISLANFITKLAEKEPELLGGRATKIYKHPYTMLSNNIQKKNGKVTAINFDGFRSDWYVNAIPGSNDLTRDLEPICKNYIKCLDWILAYYQGYDVSQHFVYSSKFSPLIIDLANVIQNYVSNGGSEHDIYRKDTDFKINPIHQLLSVMPSRSASFIPSPFNQLILKDGYLYDLCPIKFPIYDQGTDSDHEGVAILPPTDLNRVINIINELQKINSALVLPKYMLKDEEDVINYKGNRIQFEQPKHIRINKPIVNQKPIANQKPIVNQFKLTLKNDPKKPYQRKERTRAIVNWVDEPLM